MLDLIRIDKLLGCVDVSAGMKQSLLAMDSEMVILRVVVVGIVKLRPIETLLIYNRPNI